MAKAKTEAAQTNGNNGGNNGGSALARVSRLAPGGALALSPYPASDYAIVAMAAGGEGEEIRNALAENLGGTKLSAFDFQRIRVPSGGGLAWTMMNPDTGEETPEVTFEGIIVAFSDQKAFWKTGLDEAGAVQGPPNCYSTDCVKGNGDPGVFCAQCPNNVFGSAKKGTARGKACKDTRLLFICRPGDILPELLPVPPTSLKNVRDYFTAMAMRGVPYWRAVTRFRLVGDQNASKVKYAKVVCEPVGKIPDDDAGAVKGYSALVRSMLGQAPTLALRPGDFVGTEADVIESTATTRGDGGEGDAGEGEAAGAGHEGAGAIM